MISDFPGEPIGGEDAIIWHLERIDHHDWNATIAEAVEYTNVMQFHDDLKAQHQARLKILEDRFPETAKSARAYMEARNELTEMMALALAVRDAMQLSRMGRT
jgi:hypothetical protein